MVYILYKEYLVGCKTTRKEIKRFSSRIHAMVYARRFQLKYKGKKPIVLVIDYIK